MQLGINAGFGESVLQDFPVLSELGFEFVRQDLFAHQDAHDIERLVAEFADRPITGLFLLAGGHIQSPDGSHRVEPDELAERGRLVVQAAQRANLTAYAIEVGNEPDIAHIDYATRPEDFAEAVRQSHASVRDQGFVGPVITGGIANLNQRGLNYLRRMIATRIIPDDVVIGFHRYPEAGQGAQAPHVPFNSRDAEWDAFLQICAGRQTACTEFGYHTAEDKVGVFHTSHRRSDQDVADAVLWDIHFLSRRDVSMAAVFQLNDGVQDTSEERYGIRRVDGTLKPVATAIKTFSLGNT